MCAMRTIYLKRCSLVGRLEKIARDTREEPGLWIKSEGQVVPCAHEEQTKTGVATSQEKEEERMRRNAKQPGTRETRAGRRSPLVTRRAPHATRTAY